jgi:hypothetical protein
MAKVLVIEDDQTMCELLCAMLTRGMWGAAGGFEAGAAAGLAPTLQQTVPAPSARTSTSAVPAPIRPRLDPAE